MPRNALKAQLQLLKQQLSAANELDAETQALLEDVADEIEQVLEATGRDHGTVRGQIEDAIYRFEADHPQLARVLGEIGDTLAKLGI